MRFQPSVRSRALRGGARLALLLPVLAMCAAGCLTADGTLKPGGTGTLTLSYQGPPGSTEATQRSLLTAPGITIDSLTVGSDRMVSAALTVSDLAAISKTALFKNVTVTDTAKDDERVFTIKFANQPRVLKDKTVPGPKITITLPGTVVEANEHAVVDGARVSWSFTLAEWVARDKLELTARYKPAKTGDAAAPAPPSAAKPDAETK